MTQKVEWIPIEKELPLFMIEVILCFSHEEDIFVSSGYRESNDDEELSFFCPEIRSWCEPTHWMDFPQPPLMTDSDYD